MSRQLWWGHRIPVWYVHASQQEADAASQGASRGRTGTYVVARNTEEALAAARKAHGDGVGLAQEEDVLVRQPISALSDPNPDPRRTTESRGKDGNCFAQRRAGQHRRKRPAQAAAHRVDCGSDRTRPRRLSHTQDTWFSSGLWPFSTLGWPAATPELQKYYPTQGALPRPMLRVCSAPSPRRLQVEQRTIVLSNGPLTMVV